MLIFRTESCLIRIARRECKPNCDNHNADYGNSSQLLRNLAPDTESKATPCAYHYKKTRDRYGAVLDKLGCICKILMSLNMPSCCLISNHASTQSNCSNTSVTTEKPRVNDEKFGTHASCHSSISGKAKEEDGGSQGERCSGIPTERAMSGSQDEEHCSKKPTISHSPNAQVPHDIINKPEKKSACSGRSADLATVENGICKNPCRSVLSTETIANAQKSRIGECSRKSCCGDTSIEVAYGSSQSTTSSGLYDGNNDVAKQASSIVRSAARDCLEKTCCSRKAATSCSSPHDLSTKIDSSSSDIIQTLPATSAVAVETGKRNLDLEQGMCEAVHLVLNVQGMTCTGCEKNLYRSLNSMPGVSSVKASLVLSQAEFDLTKSSISHIAAFITTLEKMTGFTFTILTRPGEDQELILNGNAKELSSAEHVPDGILNVSSIDQNTIRVTYDPKVIGARALISHDFFRLTKLAPVTSHPATASGRAHVLRTFFSTLASVLLTIPVLVLAWAPLPERKVIYGAVSLGLATIIQIFIAGPFYITAFKALVFARMIDMDLLIVLSTTTAYVYSLVAFAYLAANRSLSIGQYFETSTLLVTLIMVGRTASAFARHKALELISIETLQTPRALLVDLKTREEQEIDARLLQYEDTFKVLPESSIVTDGVVISGTTEVDESMITGEAMLISKKSGSLVLAGSMNHSGTLVIRLTHLLSENTITTIGAMVNEAKSTKPRIQGIADRVAGYFVPVVLILAMLVFAIWVSVEIAVHHKGTATACVTAATYAISALIIACPCAIGLAVPMVVVIAGGVAARYGLVFKTAETLEISRKISHVIFDKTGTLTNGKFSVTLEDYLGFEQDVDMGAILGLTANSKHPVSISIANHLQAKGIQAIQVDDIVSRAGSGVEAIVGGKTIRAGSPHWLGLNDTPAIQKIHLRGLTSFCVSIDGDFVAAFGLEDTLRLDAVEAINQLKRRLVKVSIISGDHENAVQSIARQLSIPDTDVRSRCSPRDKKTYVKEALAVKNSVVLFCGDGTNDAAALTQASIGMHINEGTQIAQSAADAILMRPSLKGILVLMDLSDAYYRRVVFNFTWSFIYNLFAILLAAGAFPHARISPQFAGLGEIVSVLPVIAIAMQLRWVKF